MSELLELAGVNKIFKTQERRNGLKGVLRDLFFPNYTNIHALKDINFSIQEGNKIGLIGKNGSGKSTLIKILTGILRPTSGTLLYNGDCLYQNINTYKKNIGVIFGHRSQLYRNMILAESLELLRLIYGLSVKEFEERFSMLNESMKLDSLLKKPIRELSLGQRMKCEIASALLHNPKILFLDEPTIGLDLEVKDQFYSLIKKYHNYNNLTMIITSHDVNDISNLSQILFILNNGILEDNLSTTEFISSYNKFKEVQISFRNTIDYKERLFSTFEINNNNEELKLVSFYVDKKVSIGDILLLIRDKNNIHDIKIDDENFSNVLLSYYNKRDR